MNRSLLVLVIVTLIAGCASVKPPIEGRLNPYPASQIHFASAILKDETAVDPPTASRDDVGAILYVTVPIRATVNRALPIDYRVTFFDRNNQPVQQTGWYTKNLSPNIPDYITVNSTTSRAADFQIDFRNAQ
jgi:hypothetical protein